MNKIRFLVLGFLLTLSINVFSAEIPSFESEVINAKKLGIDTDRMTYKSRDIRLNSKELVIKFPHNGNINSSYLSSNIVINGQIVYSNNSAGFTIDDNMATTSITFPIPGTWNYTLFFYGKDKKNISLHYTVTVPKDYAFDDISFSDPNNLPQYPSGYFYELGLTMKDVSQKKVFNTASKTWDIRIKYPNEKDLKWRVSRPGISYNVENISWSLSSGNLNYTFIFPETGVYTLDLLSINQGNKILMRYKVRVTQKNSSAKENTVVEWTQGDRDLKLALWVQDLPDICNISPSVLGSTIKQYAKNEEQRVSAVYNWLELNFYYNHYALGNTKMKLPYLALADHKNSLFNPRGVCSHYSETMVYLADYAGVKVYKALGSFRNDNEQLEGHAWNVYKLNGEWKMFDPTWSIYLKDPIDFRFARIISHIATLNETKVFDFSNNIVKSVGNFLDYPEKEKIKEFPMIFEHTYFREMGFHFDTLSHKTKKISTGKSLSMSFPNSVHDLKPSVSISQNGKSVKLPSKVEYLKNSYQVQVDFENNGEYNLSISFEKPNVSRYTTSFKYIVNVNNSSSSSVANKPIATEKPIDFSGTWTTGWGSDQQFIMNLNKSGSKIFGTYDYKEGSIIGTISGKKITGTWVQSNDSSGWFEFEISEDGRAFDGKWGYEAGKIRGPWYGWK